MGSLCVCAKSKQHFSHFHKHPGLVSEVLMRKKEMEVLAKLKNIVILDCDADTLYKKVYLASGFFSSFSSSHSILCVKVYTAELLLLVSFSDTDIILILILLSSLCQAVSIADKEVFDFRMVNYTDATEGDAYLDMSQVDTGVTLTVGCIQVIFLNKFVSSILVRCMFSCYNPAPFWHLNTMWMIKK